MLALIAALCAPAAVAQPVLPHNWITPPARPGNPSRVTYFDGASLLERCMDDEHDCVVYVQGVVDGQFATILRTNRDVAYCIPNGSTPRQVKDVVVTFLKAHPDERQLRAGALVAMALAETWPQCAPRAP
jgi:hypothetical protein